MVDEVVIQPPVNDSHPIGSVQKFSTQKINFTDSHGQEWLKTGYVTQAYADYPDAIVTDGIKFDLENIPYDCMWAYSPTLNRWAGVPANTYWTSPNSYTKRTFYNDDNFDSATQQASIEDIICQQLQWSESLAMFIGTGYLPGDTSDRYFITSPDGITWTRTASAYAGMYLIVDEKSGRIITEHRATQVLYYTDDVLSGSFTTTGLPSGSRTSFSHKDFGVYCADNNDKPMFSADGGETWTTIYASSPASPFSFVVLGDTIYMLHAIEGAFSSSDGVNFVNEPEWDVFGSAVAYDDYLITVTSSAVYRTQIIGQSEKIGDHPVATNNLRRTYVRNGIVVLLATSTAYRGELYYSYIGEVDAVDGEFVRIK